MDPELENKKIRAEYFNQAADYIGESLNIIQDMIWDEKTPKETRATLDDLYERIYDVMNRVRTAEWEESHDVF